MIYVNCIYVHYNSEDDTWASELLWNSVQKDESRKAEGKIRGDFLGKIQTQYFEKSLQIAVDAVYELAKAFGIAEKSPFSQPEIYYTEEEGLLELFPRNEHLEDLIYQENVRRGWVDGNRQINSRN